MTLDDFRHLFAYSRWATARLLDSAATLTHDQWSRDLHSSFPSVGDTFAHMLGADWLWFRRWQGESPSSVPEWTDAPSREQLGAVLHAIHEEREQWLDTLHEDDLGRVVHFRRLNGEPGAQPLADLLMQVVNHATYHRGQIVTMLRQLGVAPPATDLLLFTRERVRAQTTRS